MTMTNIDEAVVGKAQHTKPCHDCPMRRNALPGWLGGATPNEYRTLCHSETPVDCHAISGQQCAGVAIYRTNVVQRAEFRLPADRDTVFATPMEFVEWHTDTKASFAKLDAARDRGQAVLRALETAQAAQRVLDLAVKEWHDQTKRALDRLVKPGLVIDRRSFGPITVAGGNSRNARRFEVAGPARLHALKPDMPELVQFLVSAWPLNEAGERMSGRAGNSRVRTDDTVTLSVYLCGERFEDPRSANEIFMEVIGKAAALPYGAAS